jgi:lysophospholipase
MTTRHDEGFFTARDEQRLYWESDLPAAPKAHVAVVHGYGDHLGRYRSLRTALLEADLAFHAFDYRGHGRADGRRGDVQRWDDYLDDLGLFWERVRRDAGEQPTFLFAHSHGALMAIHFLARRSPEGVRGVILSSPYLELGFKPPATKVWGARIAGLVVPWMPVPTGLGLDQLSTDPAWQESTGRDPLYNRNTTPRWFTESMRAQEQALQLGPKITTPAFMLVAGDDTVASPVAMRSFFETLGSQEKRLREFKGMRHEVVNEVGREEVLTEISTWISQHL